MAFILTKSFHGGAGDRTVFERGRPQKKSPSQRFGLPALEREIRILVSSYFAFDILAALLPALPLLYRVSKPITGVPRRIHHTCIPGSAQRLAARG